MIRLKIFHRHLIDLLYEHNNNQRISKTLSNEFDGFTEGFILNRMSIETFLRTVRKISGKQFAVFTLLQVMRLESVFVDWLWISTSIS